MSALRRFGVLGWPVAHSRSPAMHRAAYAALGLTDVHYQHLPVPPEVLEETVRALPRAGFAGANVTIPHKEAALALADTATDAARAIGAANTLTFDAGTGAIHADNTDAPGFVAALSEPPAGRDALVLGAGGTARAVVWALREAGAARIEVHNRTPERARALADELGAEAVDVAPPGRWLVVNTTSVGMADPAAMPVPADVLAGSAVAVDFVYTTRPEGTAFTATARTAGLATVDGLELLVRQGALSFERWTGLDAPLDAMRLAAGASTPG